MTRTSGSAHCALRGSATPVAGAVMLDGPRAAPKSLACSSCALIVRDHIRNIPPQVNGPRPVHDNTILGTGMRAHRNALDFSMGPRDLSPRRVADEGLLPIAGGHRMPEGRMTTTAS
jgi:hypothetical protein